MGKPVEMVSGSRNSNREPLREVTREEKGRGGGESRAVESRAVERRGEAEVDLDMCQYTYTYTYAWHSR